MPKVKKNGKLSKQKPKAKAERKDNIKSATTKSKSLNQSQNVNVSVSIVKNKSGGNKSKAGGSSVPAASQVKQLQPQPQNIYYQQQRDTRTPESNEGRFGELTTLLRDMSKELYSQRNIQALNQPPINPYSNPVNNKPLFEAPRIPAYVGSNNIFEDEPFEEHNSDISSVADNSTSRVTHLKIVPNTAVARTLPPQLLVETSPSTNILNNQPNQFEDKRLFDDENFGMPLTAKEIPVEEEQIITIKKKKKKTATTKFTTPRRLPDDVVINEGDITLNFDEEQAPVFTPRQTPKLAPIKQPPKKNQIVTEGSSPIQTVWSIFLSKDALKEATREERVEEIRRLERENQIDLNYRDNMKASEVYRLLEDFVMDGRTKDARERKKAQNI